MLSETLGLGGVGIDEKDFPLVGKAEEVTPSEGQPEDTVKPVLSTTEPVPLAGLRRTSLSLDSLSSREVMKRLLSLLITRSPLERIVEPKFPTASSMRSRLIR